jgi:mannose-1-phosphate guanylyltransferase
MSSFNSTEPRPQRLEKETLVIQREETSSAPANLWAVILAGDQGTPRPAAPGPHRGHRSKPHPALLGSQSLLRQTMNRVRLAIPPEKTVVVANRSRAIHLAPEFPVPDAPRLLTQLQNAGSAASLLLAAHWVRRQDPCASVAVFPSEQRILEPFAFMQHVAKVAHFVQSHDREIVLLGARPTYPDTQCEWIELAEGISDSASEAVRRVRRLWQRPSYAVARACYDSGCLWNTSVVVARAEALLQASRRLLPELDSRLDTVAALQGTRYEQRALEECYGVARQAGFSESILAAAPHLLSVSRLPPIYWSDVGMSEGAARICEKS